MIVGITGKAGAGKDTIAEHLVEYYGFTRFSFADPIKEMLSVGLSIPLEYFYDRILKEQVIPEFGKSPREMAQLAGTEFGRDLIHVDVWVNATLRKIKQTGVKNAVIADVRFDNEYDLIRSNGGVVVQVVRPSIKESYVGVAGHASEAGLSQDRIPDLQVNNKYDTLHEFMQFMYSDEKFNSLFRGK